MNKDVTSEGQKLIEDWLAAGEAERRAKSDLIRAECHLANSATALSKWLMPTDAKPGEKFCIWFGDSLIQVEYVEFGNYKLSVRSRGKSLRAVA